MRLIENENAGVMRNGLREANLLPHAFAVAVDFAHAGCVAKTHALSMAPRAKRVASVFTHAIEQQAVDEELPPGEAVREGIELRAVAHSAEECVGVARLDAKHGDAPARRLHEAGHQVHQRCLARTVGADEGGDAFGGRLSDTAVHAEDFRQ